MEMYEHLADYDNEIEEIEKKLAEMHLQRKHLQLNITTKVFDKLRSSKTLDITRDLSLLLQLYDAIEIFVEKKPPTESEYVQQSFCNEWCHFFNDTLKLISALKTTELPTKSCSIYGKPCRHIFYYKAENTTSYEWTTSVVEKNKEEIKCKIFDLNKKLAEIQSESEAENERTYECRICMVSNVQMICYTSCGHVVCEACSERLKQCPMCRINIVGSNAIGNSNGIGGFNGGVTSNGFNYFGFGGLVKKIYL
jgi:hypothetical protein